MIELLLPPPFRDAFSGNRRNSYICDDWSPTPTPISLWNLMNLYIWDDWPPNHIPISCLISWKYKEPIYLGLLSATPPNFKIVRRKSDEWAPTSTLILWCISNQSEEIVGPTQPHFMMHFQSIWGNRRSYPTTHFMMHIQSIRANRRT